MVAPSKETIDLPNFFRAYSDDRRRQELELFHREDLDHLVRYTPTARDKEGLVVFARLEPSTAKHHITAQIAHFAALRMDFEWKLYDFDEPTNLRELLLYEGFEPGDPEVFMVYSLDNADRLHVFAKQQYVQRVTNRRGVLDVVAVQERVWGRRFDWLSEQLLTSMKNRPDGISIYCAYVNGAPVGTGWTDFPEDSSYPELHGGAVLEGWRGRGIYSELYRSRLVEAAQRQYSQVTVDASPMSRPILQKLGFTYVCNSSPMRYKVG